MRTDHARTALEGLAVGDCFGEQFFGERDDVLARLRAREIPAAPWRYTDDTEMAATLTEHLAERGSVDQDALARVFAERMTPTRGYGRGAFEVLDAILHGARWQHATRAAFRGLGSFGNGAAMRVAPLGTFFAEEPLETVIAQARLSAEVTHAHEEGVSGAIAVAVAAALALRHRNDPLGSAWIGSVIEHVPRGYTREAIAEAQALPASVSVIDAAKTLGNGSAMTAPDTVPLCLWIAAHHGDDFREAMWTTVSALGDRDTTCAIVGGILAARLGIDAIPAGWRTARERVPWLDESR